MGYPTIGRNRSLTLSVPDFSGGINVSSPAQDIQDNQAASISNMWLKDGALQTRPALKACSEEAFLHADYELLDLGIDVKYSYSLYSSANAVLSDTKQTSGRLFRCGKAFFLYNYRNDEFVPLDLNFNTDDIETTFLSSSIEYEYFFENGTTVQTLAQNNDLANNNYFEIIHSKVYGYINTRFDETSDVKRFFICLKFDRNDDVDAEKIVAKLKIYDFEGELPTEYTPFSPTVILGSGTTAENRDDFNLMADTFQQHIIINRELDQYTLSYKDEAEGTESLTSYFVDITGGNANRNLGDGSDVYGNSFLNKRINYNFSQVKDSKVDQIVIYGRFKFFEWRAQYIENGYDGNERIPDGYYLTEYLYYLTPANKLTIYDINNKNCKFKFFSDEHNHEVKITDYPKLPKPKDLADKNQLFKIGPCEKMHIECTDKKLSIWFPVKSYKNIVGYIKKEDGTYARQKYDAYDAVEQCYVDEIRIFQSLVSEEKRADLVIKNPLKTTFGGTNSGYNGGTRLFVAGNPEHKNVLRWSAVNDFSYFLENNFTYIGRDDEEITALGKQDGYLVVFKEKELYAVEYASTTDSNNELVVYFPVTPISPYIGCDCPHSIQFIANRLTWLTSGGKVYTLYSENSYSERNVREISKHIENELKKHTKEQLKSAKSVDYNGNYMLFIDKTVYIWNYDANPLYNYTSSERAQQNLCWFKWDFPYTVQYVCETNGKFAVICKDDTDYQGYVLDYESDADDTVGAVDTIPIKSTYKSKLWDFGSPFTFKRINRALFEIQTMNDGEVKIYFCTESGRDSVSATLDSQYTTEENSTYTTRPHLTRVRNMGFELESDVAVKLYSAAVTAEIYGEAK